jgi:DNA polymerase-3 subunit gamma/tau
MALVQRFSREDLLRAFDLLARAETDIRSAAQPRYHLEMALLRWIHLRKLVSIEDLIAGTANLAPGVSAPVAPGKPGSIAPGKPGPVGLGTPSPVASGKPASVASGPAVASGPVVASGFSRTTSVATSAAKPTSGLASAVAAAAARVAAPAMAAPSDEAPGLGRPDSAFKDAFLAEIRKGKAVLYNMVLVQAQKIEAAGDRVTFTFSASQRALRDTFEQNRTWLESVAQKTSGRRITVAAVLQDAVADPPAGEAAAPDKKAELRKQAMADAGVQAMLEVFPAEIRDVEEM